MSHSDDSTPATAGALPRLHPGLGWWVVLVVAVLWTRDPNPDLGVPRAYYSTVLDYPLNTVWAPIRDFNNYPAYIEGVSESVIEDDRRGDEVGAVRRFCYRGNWVRQRLAAHSDEAHSLTYAGLEPNEPQQTESNPRRVDEHGKRLRNAMLDRRTRLTDERRDDDHG